MEAGGRAGSILPHGLAAAAQAGPRRAHSRSITSGANKALAEAIANGTQTQPVPGFDLNEFGEVPVRVFAGVVDDPIPARRVGRTAPSAQNLVDEDKGRIRQLSRS